LDAAYHQQGDVDSKDGEGREKMFFTTKRSNAALFMDDFHRPLVISATQQQQKETQNSPRILAPKLLALLLQLRASSGQAYGFKE
jgi:hypothetical protein